jgi:hypothetical protein
MEDKRLVLRPRPQNYQPDYGYRAGRAFGLRICDIIAIIFQRDDDASLWKNRSGKWGILLPLRKYRINWSFKWQNKPLSPPLICAREQVSIRTKHNKHTHLRSNSAS